MKKIWFYGLFAACCMTLTIASCSDDKEDNIENGLPACPVEAGEYTDATGLQLTYSGAAMLGKKVSFTPDAEGKTALLKLSGELNLAGLLPASARENAGLALNAPGVIPGELTTTLQVILKVSGDKVSFSGTDKGENGRTIVYSGEATKSSMKLDLDVTMPENALAGSTWNLAEPKAASTAPVHFIWEADPSAGTLKNVISIVLQKTPVAGDMTVLQLLSQALEEVSFLPDGNIQARYKNNPADAQSQLSELNLAMYTVEGNQVKVYLNVSQIVAAATLARAESGTENQLLQVLLSLIPHVAPMLGDGIPLVFVGTEGEDMNVYLGTEVLKPILQALTPLINDENKELLIELMKANGAGSATFLLNMIWDKIPDIVDGTTDIQLGLNLVPAVAAE